MKLNFIPQQGADYARIEGVFEYSDAGSELRHAVLIQRDGSVKLDAVIGTDYYRNSDREGLVIEIVLPADLLDQIAQLRAANAAPQAGTPHV